MIGRFERRQDRLVVGLGSDNQPRVRRMGDGLVDMITSVALKLGEMLMCRPERFRLGGQCLEPDGRGNELVDGGHRVCGGLFRRVVLLEIPEAFHEKGKELPPLPREPLLPELD